MDQFWAGFGWGIVTTIATLFTLAALSVLIYGIRNSKTHANGEDNANPS